MPSLIMAELPVMLPATNLMTAMAAWPMIAATTALLDSAAMCAVYQRPRTRCSPEGQSSVSRYTTTTALKGGPHAREGVCLRRLRTPLRYPGRRSEQRACSHVPELRQHRPDDREGGARPPHRDARH